MFTLFAFSLLLLAVANVSNAYWLMGLKNILTVERMDPVVDPGEVSGHVHTVFGGSNFRFTTSTESLRQSECTSTPIVEDKSNYWFPHLYFEWANGSFTSLTGGAVIYYLFSDTSGATTAFPDDFRMISGDPTLRGYDPTSFAQQAVTFLCLDYSGVSTRFNGLPAQSCPDGIRAQINFPSCWDGKNVDSPTHNTHVAFLSTGPDSGTCEDPNFPVTLPRIFIEMYWASNDFDGVRSQAMNTSQPFVFSQGDPTGYGYHADFINGWDAGVLQNAVNNCNCDIYGDPTCCGDAHIFTLDSSQECHITKSVDEVVEGTISQLPGNNPVRAGAMKVPMLTDPVTPPILSSVCVYEGTTPPATCGSNPALVSRGFTAAAAPPFVLAQNNNGSSAPASSPHSPPPGDSTGSHDDGADDAECSGEKPKSKTYKKSSRRPHARDITGRFDHAF
jgi:hypothetical protein